VAVVPWWVIPQPERMAATAMVAAIRLSFMMGAPH
jgi:hypothetical protein